MNKSSALLLMAVLYQTQISLCLPASASPNAVNSKITRSGDTTTIVIHDSRPRKKSPVAAKPAQPDWHEVNVQAPSLTAVPAPATNRARPNEQSVTWTQSYEPGPATAAAANKTGSFGGSILSTQPYYPYGFGNGYGYGYGYSPYSNYSNFNTYYVPGNNCSGGYNYRCQTSTPVGHGGCHRRR